MLMFLLFGIFPGCGAPGIWNQWERSPFPSQANPSSGNAATVVLFSPFIWCHTFRLSLVLMPLLFVTAWHTRVTDTTSTRPTARVQWWRGVGGTSSAWSCPCSTHSSAATPQADCLPDVYWCPDLSRRSSPSSSSSSSTSSSLLWQGRGRVSTASTSLIFI